MQNENNKHQGKCLVMHGSNTKVGGRGIQNLDWWPNQLNLKILHQNDRKSNPHDESYDYAQAFKSLDLKEVKQAIEEVFGGSLRLR
ncbi:hypothetical protein [Vibrio superstes]|uniref:Uncharacterized protein n=1 Tax=Vibrio superstes NBRC 103154 TaxID=1219062 RepID=A0A511QLB4_9VIBR|nr:hypothetical protein [Vibrio superstes]GEM77967.1 hypothetical protein VSU01S_02120 [Vibrio superstes NBRC 103154]